MVDMEGTESEVTLLKHSGFNKVPAVLTFNAGMLSLYGKGTRSILFHVNPTKIKSYSLINGNLILNTTENKQFILNFSRSGSVKLALSKQLLFWMRKGAEQDLENTDLARWVEFLEYRGIKRFYGNKKEMKFTWIFLLVIAILVAILFSIGVLPLEKSPEPNSLRKPGSIEMVDRNG